jgi:hypothetical protein
MKNILLYILTIILLNSCVLPQVIKNYWYQQGPYGGSISNIDVSYDNKIAVIANRKTSVLNYEWVEVTDGNDAKSVAYIPGSNYLVVLKNNSIFKTSDNGYHWIHIFTSRDTLADFTFLKTDASKILTWSSNNIYLIDLMLNEYDSVYFGKKIFTISTDPVSPPKFFVISGSTLYSTINLGKEFTFLKNFIKPVKSLAISSDSASVFLVSTSSDDTAYISKDKGLSWDYFLIDEDLDQRINQFVFHPLANNKIFAATNKGVYYSSDRGKQWSIISTGLTFPYFGVMNKLGVNKLYITSNEIFAGTKEGLFQSVINKDQWNQIGPLNETINSLGKNNQYYNERIFAGTPNGIKYFDYYNWVVSPLYSADSLPINSVLTSTLENNVYVLAASINKEQQPIIYRSTDNGDSWNIVFVGDTGVGKINQFLQIRDSSNIFYALTENKNGKSGLLRSRNFGDSLSWSVVSTLNKNFNYAVYRNSTKNLFFLLDKKELYQMNPNDSLEYLSTIPGNHYNTLYFDNLYNSLYAAGDGVKRTLDLSSWENFGLDSIEVVEVVDDYSSIFAATKYYGVYANYYTLGEWYPYYTGLPLDIEITDIVNFSHGILHIGSKNNSVFMIYTIVNGVKGTKPIPNSITLSQNFPNPFNPSTVISFQLPVTSKVSLKVYDILGNEVATLVNEEKPAGSYEVEFSAGSRRDGSNLSSGIYFYVLKAGENRFCKKMCLLK